MERILKGIIRVLVVDDSPLMCKVLMNVLNSDPQIIVTGVAYNGKEAVEIVPVLKPDIITMDIHMPLMDGLEATKQIMAYYPTPILVVSTSIFKVGMDKVFTAISFGALDVIEKGKMEMAGDRQTGSELLSKIKLLSRIKVLHHPLAKLELKRAIKVIEVPKNRVADRIVAIVASTGGPQAILEILSSFPKDFPCGVVIVQHIASGFVEGFVEWLNSQCQIKVKVAEDSEEITPGVAYIAPSDFQMKVVEGGRIHLANGPPHDGHCPSADILLESVARVYTKGAVGVILTGMGSDGALGMKSIMQMQGETIAQDEKSCSVFGMPKVAIEMGAVNQILPLERISEGIVKTLK